MKFCKLFIPTLLIILSIFTSSILAKDDISLTKTDYIRSDGTEITFYIIKFKPELYNIEVYYSYNEGMKIEEFKEDKNVLAGINCGFFMDPYLPVGLLISSGKKINDLDPYWDHTGVFYVTSDPDDLYGLCTKDAFYDTDVTEAVQSFPLLVWNEEPYVKYKDKQKASRSAVAFDDEGNILLIATDGGISLYEFSRALCKQEWNCKKALNLDGGSSTQLYYKDSLLHYSITGFFKDNKVSNFLLVKKKDD